MRNNRLWYKAPAKEWTDSLPLGNGSIGAMVFGGIKRERISLNEETLWSGYPQDKNRKDAAKYLPHARELAFQGKYEELSQYVEENMLGDYTESYLPLGDLYLDFSKVDEANVPDYYRELNMNEAKTLTSFKSGDATICSEAFVSNPDRAFFMKIKSDVKGKTDFKLSFDSKLRTKVYAEGNCLYISGLCPSHVEPSYLYSENPVIYEENPAKKGIKFFAIAKVDTKGGSITTGDDCLNVENAEETMITFVVRSSFNGFDKQPWLEGKDCEALAKKDLEALKGIDFETLLSRHKADFSKLFNRVDFYLDDKSRVDLPTDERLERFGTTKDDKELFMLLFQYGRYLLISSSRPGNLPANLQGIWNEELRAPWSGNYTLNINTEMNYWLAENCNLSECHEPLFDLIDNLQVTGAKTAKIHYGARGVVSHHNSDIWCISNPVGRTDKWSIGYAFWCMSFGWLCRHLYEHYEYTQDADFLGNRAFPAIKNAVAFFLDILVEDGEGHLIVSPSTSPENGYLKDGKILKVSKTTTMSTAIVRECFSNYLLSCEILSLEDELKENVSEAIKKLLDYKIGKRGNLCEWDEDYDDAEETHRHISHLYPLYPGEEINIRETPELAEGCKRALEIRGDGGTGWSLGWKVNTWARLGDGNHAERLLKNQLNFVKTNECDYSNGGGTYRNMFDAHPPFQIDGNFAASAGIAEMFLQNTKDGIILLPALPEAWEDGYIKGLRAKGGITVDIYFKKNRLEKAVLIADTNHKDSINVYCGGKVIPVSLCDKAPFEISGDLL